MSKDYTFEKRRYVLGGITVLIVLLYIIRLLSLQVMTDEYKRNAANNAFLNQVQYPARGSFYDRNHHLLVYNLLAYDVTVIPHDVEYLDTLDFCRTLNITKDQFIQRMTDMQDLDRNPGYSKYTSQVFMTQLTSEECAPFREKLFKFKGFNVQERSIRQYVYDSAGQILGDIGEVSMGNIEEDDYYSRGDYIGKQGIEKSYERYLRGYKGVNILLRDANGRIKGKYLNGKYDHRAVPGRNLMLGLDINLQMLGEKLMRNKIGSIVAIDPKTGEILCMVSSPFYNPQMLVGRTRGKNQQSLQKDWRKPLLNRSIMGVYPPGSTFKAAQALACLQEGVITPGTSFACHHGFFYAGRHLGCHGHRSPLDLIPAIGTSCNTYFCYSFLHFIESRKFHSHDRAMTVWKDHMVDMGFGYKLGVDLPGEKRGLIPNAKYYDKAYKGHWNGLTIISDAIGQGEILATPLQIANLAATIANRGYYITPHIVKHIQAAQLDARYYEKKYTGIERKYYEDVVRGMRNAVMEGTCRVGNIPGLDICGKTGTAQNHGIDHSAFMGFAPMNNPKIAIMVYVENGGWGADFGVPIGALMMEQYINGKLSPDSEKRAEAMSNKVIAYGNRER
jgi:penicillin-binding protein 2